MKVLRENVFRSCRFQKIAIVDSIPGMAAGESLVLLLKLRPIAGKHLRQKLFDLAKEKGEGHDDSPLSQVSSDFRRTCQCYGLTGSTLRCIDWASVLVVGIEPMTTAHLTGQVTQVFHDAALGFVGFLALPRYSVETEADAVNK